MEVFLAIVALITVTFFVMLIIGALLSGPKYRGAVSDHFNGSQFLNPAGIRAKGGAELLKWMLSRKRGPWGKEVVERYGKHPLAHFKDGIRVTFVNHSTFLIQVDGVNILTDPVWSRRASPFRWVGPKRMTSPGLRFGDLPRIHLVLITHNHYDHLDIETLRMVVGAHHPEVVAPLGVKKFLDRYYVNEVTELDWWQPTEKHGLSVTSVPAVHFSGRGLLDRDATLWCGYVIRSTRGNIYFAGDTGYHEETFAEVASRCGPFRLSFLPIGAYKPEWFMSPIHVSPEKAVQIHQLVGSRNSVAMHFGTFPLADDGRDEPVDDLQSALRTSGIPEGQFLALEQGEVTVFE